ncbi:MAG TPA: hypothetical protein ENN14_01205, partial [Chloroflexi bacterium]|nr:hypothetical protein [Chloroflexota bacterium]
MFGRKFMALVGMLTLGSLLLVACTPAPTQAPVTEAPATEVPAAEVPPTPVPETPTPEPPPPEPKVLVICQSREPESLYLYGSAAQEAQHIWQALYDGPIDNRTYAYQSVILEKLPSLEDGDATIVTVIVQAGDWVVNAEDVVVELSEGVRVRPAGCRAPDCEIEFDGEPVQMDQ